MRLRIVRPLPPMIEGIDLSFLRFGASYDLRPPLYDFLLVTGYGVPDDPLPVDVRPPKSKAKRRPRR
jgi:hypothetical protein